MATRPSTATYPYGWATSPPSPTDILDPGAGQRATGWLPLQVITYNVLNFVQNMIGVWLEYFEPTIRGK